MTDTHRPFARTFEAAQQAHAKRADETDAPSRSFSRTAALSPGAPPDERPDTYRAGSTFAVNRLERRPVPRRRLPWLFTGVMAILFGQIVWWAYQEVDGEQPAILVIDEAPPITEAAFEPPAADPPDTVLTSWPPIPQTKPADGWTFGPPPTPVFKPR